MALVSVASRELAVALAACTSPMVEARAPGQVGRCAVAGSDVADVEIATPLALAVEVVVTSRSGATPMVPMNGVIGQLMRVAERKRAVPCRPARPRGVCRKILVV